MTLTATIADGAGNTSAPAVVTFTVAPVGGGGQDHRHRRGHAGGQHAGRRRPGERARRRVPAWRRRPARRTGAGYRRGWTFPRCRWASRRTRRCPACLSGAVTAAAARGPRTSARRGWARRAAGAVGVPVLSEVGIDGGGRVLALAVFDDGRRQRGGVVLAVYDDGGGGGPALRTRRALDFTSAGGARWVGWPHGGRRTRSASFGGGGGAECAREGLVRAGGLRRRLWRRSRRSTRAGRFQRGGRRGGGERGALAGVAWSAVGTGGGGGGGVDGTVYALASFQRAAHRRRGVRPGRRPGGAVAGAMERQRLVVGGGLRHRQQGVRAPGCGTARSTWGANFCNAGVGAAAGVRHRALGRRQRLERAQQAAPEATRFSRGSRRRRRCQALAVFDDGTGAKLSRHRPNSCRRRGQPLPGARRAGMARRGRR